MIKKSCKLLAVGCRLKGIKNNKQKKVPVSDLVQYVKKKVAEVNEQTPIGNPLKGVGDEGGEFVFYLKN